jgi:processive 1,2-diacylglycerol beta-glucosyltransferase
LQEKLLRPVQRVLIITGSAGGGHVSAANALQEEAAALGLDCKVIDALEVSKFFRFSTQSLYEAFVRICPPAWGVFYDFLERNKVALGMHTRFTTTNLWQLDDLIHDYKPDWIICTHDVALPRIATLRRYPHDFQLAVTVTDVHPHILWIEGSVQAGAELVFVSCHESKANVLSRSSIPAEKIIVSGIPIGSAFTTPRALTYQAPRNAVPTILVTSGMIGAGRYLDVLKSLSGLKTKVKLIIVCGRNENIYKKLNKMAKGLNRVTNHEFDIRGKVDREEMAKLLRECTMLVGKPGGLTMSEALASGCPFVIYTPFLIPGQEQKNAEFLVGNGIGIRAGSPAELCKTVQHLLESKNQLKQMRENARANGKPDAAREVLQRMLKTELAPISV